MHATKHYICFLDFYISDNYLADFESASPSEHLFVTSTPWFDLKTPEGRRRATRNIVAIIQRAAANTSL